MKNGKFQRIDFNFSNVVKLFRYEKKLLVKVNFFCLLEYNLFWIFNFFRTFLIQTSIAFTKRIDI